MPIHCQTLVQQGGYAAAAQLVDQRTPSLAAGDSGEVLCEWDLVFRFEDYVCLEFSGFGQAVFFVEGGQCQEFMNVHAAGR